MRDSRSREYRLGRKRNSRVGGLEKGVGKGRIEVAEIGVEGRVGEVGGRVEVALVKRATGVRGGRVGKVEG